jgi:hypothetical protein
VVKRGYFVLVCWNFQQSSNYYDSLFPLILT